MTVVTNPIGDPGLEPGYLDERSFERLVRELYDVAAGDVTAWCARTCAAAGVPFDRIYEQRWNGRGEPIGPRLELREEAAEIVHAVVAAMARARDEAFAAIVSGRGEGAS